MAPGPFMEAYFKFAPKWIKCIRWKQNFDQWIERKKIIADSCWMPLITALVIGGGYNSFAYVLLWRRPRTEEDLLYLQRNYKSNTFEVHCERGQYKYDKVPLYDMSERRLKYPQYYAGRYDGFKKYDRLYPEKTVTVEQ